MSKITKIAAASAIAAMLSTSAVSAQGQSGALIGGSLGVTVGVGVFVATILGVATSGTSATTTN